MGEPGSLNLHLLPLQEAHRCMAPWHRALLPFGSQSEPRDGEVAIGP